MRGQKHSDETRGAALAALLAGQSVSEIARQYKLPESTVRSIKKLLGSDEFAKVREKKEEALAELIEGHLHSSLKAAAAIADQATDATWRNKQDADKLGVFYGILTDKSVRILEAAESAAAVEEEWPEVV